MIHPDSVKAWEAGDEMFRERIRQQNEEIKRLIISNDAYSRRINELEGEIERQREKIRRLTNARPGPADRTVP